MSAECCAGNIPLGYKQTEVGVIPEDWDFDYIDNLSNITTGGRNTQDHVDDGLYPFFVRSQTVERINTYSFDGEAVLTAGDGVGTGKVFHYINGKFDAHQRVYRMSDFNERIKGYFFYLYFSTHFYNRIMQMTAKSSVDSVRREMIARMLIPIPPKAEQESIAEALSDTDALIESFEQLVAKKRQIKQGAMQELLTGKRRLPGFSEEWETKMLGNIAVLKARIGWQGLTTNEYLNSGDYYLVTGTEFKDGYIDWSNCHYVTESRYKQDKNIQLKEHDVLVTKDGTIGKVALINHLHKPATLNSGVFVIRPIDDAFHPEFFYYLLCSSIFTEFLIQLSAGSTINHLYQKDFVNFIYKTPATIKEQIAIAAFLSDMDSEITALEEKLAKVRQLKQGMMQELLTGRIRLI
jgi:type I restriction enzyme S subunit